MDQISIGARKKWVHKALPCFLKSQVLMEDDHMMKKIGSKTGLVAYHFSLMVMVMMMMLLMMMMMMISYGLCY